MNQSINFKQINKLAIPAIFAGIVEPLISISDLAIVGSIPVNSKEVIAAVGIAGSFISAIIWGLAQTKSAISALVSQNLGKNKIKHLPFLYTQSFLFVITVSIILLSLAQLFKTQIFEFYNASGLILEYSIQYFSIRAWGLPITLVTFLFFGIFRGLQNTKYAMWIAIAGGSLNIILDYLFVHGICLKTPLGIEGAAYASLIAQSTMLLLAFIIGKKKFNLRFYWNTKIHPELGEFIQISLNLFVRTLALNIALYFCNAFATKYGDTEIATYTIMMNIWLFCSFFIDGYANAGNAISGKLKGQKDFSGLLTLSKKLRKAGVLVALSLVIVMLLLYNQICYLFTSDIEVNEFFQSYFWLVIITQPINSIAFIYDGIFKGLGNAKFLRNLLIISTFIFFLPSLYILDYYHFRFLGLWLSIIIWMHARAIILVVKFETYINSFLKSSSKG